MIEIELHVRLFFDYKPIPAVENPSLLETLWSLCAFGAVGLRKVLLFDFLTQSC